MSLEAMMSAWEKRRGGKEGDVTTVGVGKRSGHEQEKPHRLVCPTSPLAHAFSLVLDSQTTQPTTALVTPSETRG